MGSKEPLTDMKFNADRTLLLVCAEDSIARLVSFATISGEGDDEEEDEKGGDGEVAVDLEVVKKYHSDKPVRSGAIHPKKNIVILAGGQHARNVTTTAHGKGRFDLEFFHMVYEEKIGVVKTGHFSPTNTCGFSPDGSQFVTGAEEGNVRIFTF